MTWSNPEVILGSDLAELPHLPRHHFPILPDTTELKLERAPSRESMYPLNRVLHDHPQGAGGNARLCYDRSGGLRQNQATLCDVLKGDFPERLGDPCDFADRQITKRRSEKLGDELSRLIHLKWMTVEMNEARPDIDV